MGDASIPITVTAAATPGRRLQTVPAYGAARIRHVLPAPASACPVSRNPLSGTVTVSYRPAGAALEVVSLAQALAWATSRNEGAPPLGGAARSVAG